MEEYKNVILQKNKMCHYDEEHVILSEAKNLKNCTPEKGEILRDEILQDEILQNEILRNKVPQNDRPMTEG